MDYLLFNKNSVDLLSNQTRISVTDFGAGSKVFKSNERKVSHIAKHAGISKSRGKLLARITQYLGVNSSLEIGTSLGMSTIAIANGNLGGKITTIEGCHKTAEIARGQFSKFKLENITSIVGEFDIVLDKIVGSQKFDLIFFDGNHDEQATIRYYNSCLQTVHNDSVFIFDDIYWNTGMNKAWKYIIQHPKVTVSIDTYKWGIVFFRKEQEKEHFVIRV